jgi:ABC-type phosphate transport system substrate-binding protein
MPKATQRSGSKSGSLDVTKAIVLLLAVTITGLIMLLLFANVIDLTSLNRPLITTFDECVAAQGSRVQESYPAVCVTTDGSQFVQPLNEVPTSITE